MYAICMYRGDKNCVQAVLLCKDADITKVDTISLGASHNVNKIKTKRKKLC